MIIVVDLIVLDACGKTKPVKWIIIINSFPAKKKHFLAPVAPCIIGYSLYYIQYKFEMIDHVST